MGQIYSVDKIKLLMVVSFFKSLVKNFDLFIGLQAALVKNHISNWASNKTRTKRKEEPNNTVGSVVSGRPPFTPVGGIS